MRTRNVIFGLLAALATGSAALAQTALGSSWSYQGVLEQSGSPVNGHADFQFTLWTAAIGGNTVGGAVSRNTVPIDNGVFQVDVDFGIAALSGDARWLQIAVRSPSGVGNFTPLGTRQRVNPSPYALKVPGLAAHASAPNSAIYIDSIGEVGIGTTNPIQDLDVAGTVHALEYQLRGGDLSLFTSDNTQDQAINFRNSGAAYAWRIYREDAGGLQANLHFAGGVSSQDPSTLSNFLTMKNTGRVGIGIENPAAKLHVAGSDWFDSFMISASGNSGPGLFLDADDRDWAIIGTNATAGAGPEKLGFYDVTGFAYRMVIDSSGNVGIGTVNPAARLDVAGTTRTQVLTITGGSDIAEPYNVTAAGETEAQPGMVVSIDPARIGELRIAGEAYDTTVAGVISGANGVNVGLMLTQEGSVADGQHPVAMNGRVWTWCDASSGPIKAGDLLTTSDTPGHAMKASDRQRAGGATIGKAMSSLESGRGLVLVLVNLQ